MPSKEFVAALDEVRRRMLHPTEHNREELCERLRTVLAALPSDVAADDPWLATATPDFGWLREFERIPEGMLDRDRVLAAVAASLTGQLRWHSPGALFNITPQPMVDTVAAAAVANLYNPNALWDLISAGTLEVERQIVRQLAGLAGWSAERAGGTFSFGGKAGLMYAIRLGLNRCQPGVSRHGLASGAAPMVVTTQHNHDSVEAACSLLGLGSRACLRIPAAANEIVSPNAVANVVGGLVASGVPIACVVLSGGNILHNAVDPVQPVAEALTELCRDLPYRPYVHFDTAFGWPWLFFADYDFGANPLGIDPVTLDHIERTARLMVGIEAADSMTADFHKAGFCPYPSSIFLTKEAAELRAIHDDEIQAREWQPWGENIVLHHTIEHSRSAAGILAAWVALQSAGRIGFRVSLANAVAVNNAFRALLPDHGYELLNAFATGLSSVYWPVPPGGPKSFAEMRHADPALIDDANRYTHALYRRLAGLDGTGDHERIVLGFLPEYGFGERGQPMSALRLLPSSLHHEESSAAVLVERMAAVKKDFDGAVRHRTEPLAGLRVRHVPE